MSKRTELKEHLNISPFTCVIQSKVMPVMKEIY